MTNIIKIIMMTITKIGITPLTTMMINKAPTIMMINITEIIIECDLFC